MQEQLRPANTDDDDSDSYSDLDPDDEYPSRDQESGDEQSTEDSPLTWPLNWRNLPQGTWAPVMHASESDWAEASPTPLAVKCFPANRFCLSKRSYHPGRFTHHA